MKVCFLISSLFCFTIFTNAQQTSQLRSVLENISTQWKSDSNSCKGYRLNVSKAVLACKPDSISKAFLLSKLGKPNYTQKFFSGITKKNYVAYVYYIYMDTCPKMRVEGKAIVFAFDETESYLVEIEERDYCG